MVAVTTDIARLETWAAAKGIVLYCILRRRAGWAFQWYDELRCTTPLPPSASETLLSINCCLSLEEVREQMASAHQSAREARAARLDEGLFVRGFAPTLEEAVRKELEYFLD